MFVTHAGIITFYYSHFSSIVYSFIHFHYSGKLMKKEIMLLLLKQKPNRLEYKKHNAVVVCHNKRPQGIMICSIEQDCYLLL